MRVELSNQVVLSGAALVVGLALTNVSGHASASAAPPPSHWLSANTKTHTATLTLEAGYNGALSGFNFDGYGKGAMVVSIPSGYRVTIMYHNKGEYPHSVLVTPYAKKDLVAGWPVAFRGAASTNASDGAAPGSTQRFSFAPNKVGVYAIICAAAGHEQAGMWDVLRVTRGGRPSVMIDNNQHKG
jgi:plastocyanin